MARSSRKQEILQAALACFTEFGVEATTIEMIRDRSGASIGSLYHHFGNRERIIAALYLEGIGEYAALLEAGLIETLDAEACVRLFVTSYIDWVVANPDWARFVLHNRGRVEAGEMGPAMTWRVTGWRAVPAPRWPTAASCSRTSPGPASGPDGQTPRLSISRASISS